MISNKTLSVAIMSGKGGVGKTNIALNLSYALSALNHPLLLVDCDLGLANIDVLLGLAPSGTLQDIILHGAHARDIIMQLNNHFFFLPAASGVPQLSELDEDMMTLLVERLTPTLPGFDFTFFDCGAGVNSMVLAFACMVHMRIIVVTPEPSSLTDSYALMKILHSQYHVRTFHIIVNQVENPKEEAITFQRLSSACSRFLGFSPVLLGSIRQDKAIPEAVRRQKPLLELTKNSPAAKGLHDAAARLTKFRSNLLPMISDAPLYAPGQYNPSF